MGTLKMVLIVAAVVGAIVGGLYLTVIDFWVIPDDDPILAAAIRPLLTPGDELVILRSTGASMPGLVRCSDPNTPGKYVIARVIGDPKTSVRVANGVVYLNGKRNPSPHKCEPPNEEVKDGRTERPELLDCWYEDVGGSDFGVLRGNDSATPPYETTPMAGQLILVSDNRFMHLDSRDFGPVQADTCNRIILRTRSAQGFFEDPDHRFTYLY